MEKTCAKCNAVLTRCVATSAAGKFSAIKEPVKNFTNKESSELRPYVCADCGYTEWYVDEPEHFKQKTQ